MVNIQEAQSKLNYHEYFDQASVKDASGPQGTLPLLVIYLLQVCLKQKDSISDKDEVVSPWFKEKQDF